MERPVITTFGAVPVRMHVHDGEAAVLLYHGLRVSAETVDAEGRALARAGMTAIAVDAPHHGARRSSVLDTMPDTGTIAGYATLLRILREARDEVPALVDHARSLGYRRVAIAGVSMGAFVALAAATIEPRLAAVASLLGSPDFTPHDGEAAARVSELSELLDISPHLRWEKFAPRPLLLLNGERDVNVRPEPARSLHTRLRPVYDAFGGSLVHREYPVDHFAPPDEWRRMVEEAVAFLRRALGVP